METLFNNTKINSIMKALFVETLDMELVNFFTKIN